jgi:hypothetical protein
MDELAGTDWRREGDAIVRDLKFDALGPGSPLATIAPSPDERRRQLPK